MIRFVNSRRLGRSLGIDLVKHKICSLDCVYCEAGATTDLTLDRKPYCDIDEVMRELSAFMNKKPVIDFITFSGLGEPTLNSQIGEVIKFIKKKWFDHKLCLITNSTLLSDEKLQEDLLPCDLILPSLDAVSEEVFQIINRPHPNLKANDVVAGLVSFRQIFKNQMWMEIFVIEGVNDTDEEITKLKEACFIIKPDKIQLNTLDRAPTEDWVKKAGENGKWGMEFI